MARIRTVKPEFFRHELLQELEINHPGKYPMFVFEGLWGHCDSNGVFPWKPKQLKLDILPFIPFEMAETLQILEEAKQIFKGDSERGTFGFIPTFRTHQRLTGKEATDGERYPFLSEWETLEKHRGENGERQESQEKEGKEEKERKGILAQSVSASSRLKISFDYRTGKFLNISEDKKGLWSSKFPALDVLAELLEMEAWALANPKNRKSNWERFITNWLIRNQDKSRNNKGKKYL